MAEHVISTKKKIFLETPRKFMREIPWEPFRKVSLFFSLLAFIGSIAATVATNNPAFEWGWWWMWFGLFLTFLPMIQGRVACGWFCPYAALHDLVFANLKYRRLKWPKKLAEHRFLVMFAILAVLGTIEIFWEWDFFIWYCRIFLVLAVIWGLVFEPRDWCKYVCVLGAYAQLYARIRVFGVRVDESMCLRCSHCLCDDVCIIGVDWTNEVIGKEKWITPDYCVACMRCANTCPAGAVFAWRVH